MRISRRATETGNVLFLILIAVALFAALSYAVTQSTRSGGGDAGKEQTQLAASKILQYVSSVKTAVMRMKINGVADEDFCFDSPAWDSVTPTGKSLINYTHSRCSNNANRVFHPEGGGVAFQDADDSWFDPAAADPDPDAHWTWGIWLYMGTNPVENIGTTENELVMFLGPIKRDICLAINEKMGISDPSGAAYDPVPYDYVCCGWDQPRQFGRGNNNPATIYTFVDHIGRDDATVTKLAGQETGCGYDSSHGYYFYNVLLAR